MLKRVGPAIAGLVVVAALAIGVPSATGHPEECATRPPGPRPTAATRRTVLAGAEESICTSKPSRAATTTPAQLAAARPARPCELIASRAKPGPFAADAAFNSDLAFEDGYAYQGNYEGVSIWDVRDPSNPTLVSQIDCPGSQNDVTVNDGILITSTDSRRTNDRCTSSRRRPPTRPRRGRA